MKALEDKLCIIFTDKGNMSNAENSGKNVTKCTELGSH